MLCIGDIFHAAPNVDHSQDFVRRDIKEWLNWLRNDIGFDGWRLDFVRLCISRLQTLAAVNFSSFPL